MAASPPKLVLCVIDAMAPEMLTRAIEEGVVPMLELLVRRGTYVPDCVAAFPSVTPVCAASIVTGVAQDEHLIPAMNWYHREERRYVEYGSSFRAAQRFGIARQLTDTVYNMNRAHLSQQTLTVFESLDDAGVRTAGTTYLMYRGRHRHEPQRDTAFARVLATLLRHPVMGPLELFYADIFASRRTGCRSSLGMPGLRDRHSGCVSSYMVENDLFDFLLLSLPDNDWHSHKRGPEAQIESLAAADLQLARVMDAGGGPEEFLERARDDRDGRPLPGARAQHDRAAGRPRGARRARRPRATPRASRGSLCAPRSARRWSMRCTTPSATRCAPRSSRSRSRSRASTSRSGSSATPTKPPARGSSRAPSTASCASAPAAPLVDVRGARWSVDGALGAIGARVEDDRLLSPDYPDALARAWAALTCANSGEVLLSAAPGYEFIDWGRQAHAGGGSHGSLHACDSLGALVLAGVEPPRPAPEQWAIRDVAALVRGHFGVD